MMLSAGSLVKVHPFLEECTAESFAFAKTLVLFTSVASIRRRRAVGVDPITILCL